MEDFSSTVSLYTTGEGQSNYEVAIKYFQIGIYKC